MVWHTAASSSSSSIRKCDTAWQQQQHHALAASMRLQQHNQDMVGTVAAEIHKSTLTKQMKQPGQLHLQAKQHWAKRETTITPSTRT
jgi:hypothetical protein